MSTVIVDNERILYRHLDVALLRLPARLNAGDRLPDAFTSVAIGATDPVTQSCFAALGAALRDDGQWQQLANRLQIGWPTGQHRLDLPLKRSVKYYPPNLLITALESCEPTEADIQAALTLYCAGRIATLSIEPGSAASDQTNLFGWLASIRDSIAGRVDPVVSARVDTICVLVAQVILHTAELSAGSREM